MKKIEIGLDLTKEIKKLDNFIVQGDLNPDMTEKVFTNVNKIIKLS